MDPKKREHLLAFGAVACFLLLFGDWLLLSPLRGVWGQRAKRVGQLEKAITEGEMLAERTAALEERWREMASSCLPLEKSAAENRVFSALAQWTRASNIALDSRKPRWVSERDAADRFEMLATARGDMPAIARFLYELETDPLAVKIEEVQITSQDRSAERLILGVRFSGLQLGEDAPNSETRNITTGD